MANQNTPVGLNPIQRFRGAAFRNSQTVYFVPAANTHALFVGDPVVKIAGSANGNGVNGVDLATAGATGSPAVGNAITGVVVGFVGVAPAGSTKTPSFYPLSGIPGPAYRPASTTQDYYVLVNDDPDAEYEIQVDGTNVIAVASIGKNANLLSGAGNAFTGNSGWTLNSATPSTDVLQVNIVGVEQEINNDPTLAYCKFIVRLNVSTETNRSAGI